MTATREITAAEWRTRVERALREGYFVRDEGATVEEIENGFVCRWRWQENRRDDVVGLDLFVTVGLSGDTGALVGFVVTHTFSAADAVEFARVLNLAARSAEYVERGMKSLRVN